MILQEDFTRLVDEQLAAKGWTRSELARHMGVGRQYVTNYLNGRSSAGPDVMERFFTALGCRVRLVIESKPLGKGKRLEAAG